MADGTLFGLVRDINDRRTAARVRDSLRQNDYFNKPMEAITALNDAGFLDQAVNLRDQEAARQALLAKQQREMSNADQERYRTALQGVTRSLQSARDTPGLDLGSEYDRLAPSFVRGFGMKPEEVTQLREQVVGNPQILDQFAEMFADPNKQRFGVLPGGGQVYNQNTGAVGARNPGTVKTVQMKRGDGGYDLYVVDQEGNLVNSGVSTPGGAPAAAPGTGGITGGTYSGPLGINPQARGVRNNNMGNIKDGPWAKRQPGYVGSDGTFAKFATPEAGTAAQESLLTNFYVNGQRTVNDIVNKYLGGPNNKENSTASQANYKAYVAGRLGIPADQPVPQSMTQQLAQAMREFENGGGPAPARGGPVASTPGKPVTPEGWRDLTPDEKRTRGLDPNRVYQIGISGANTGRIQNVGGQPAVGKAGKPAGVTLQAHQIAVQDMQRLRDQANRILKNPAFDQATGSIQGRLPSIFQSTVGFDNELTSYRDATVVRTLQSMKQASPNGASGFGSLTEKEGERLQNANGPLSQTDPTTLRRTLQSNAHDAMISIGMLFNIPPDATELLIRNPALAPAFDVKYGVGLAKKILGN